MKPRMAHSRTHHAADDEEDGDETEDEDEDYMADWNLRACEAKGACACI